MISLRHIAIAAALTLTAHAAKWDEMDYGRFLSATYANADGKTTLDGKGCASNKGIAIKLGNSEGALLFDTELCRFAGGWLGGFVKTKGVVFDGGHGPNPGPADKATIVFQVNPGPGWSKGGDFNDPRKLPTGPGAAKVPFGPLPHDWAKYRGLYLRGDDVVVTYTVGTAGVMELAGLDKAGDVQLLTRTFNVVSAGAGASVALADAPEGATATIDGFASISGDKKDAENVTVIGVVDAPAGAQLKADGGRVSLKLASLAAGQRFKVVYAHGPAADVAKLGDAIKGAAKPADLADFKNGGPAHWPETVTTKGARGSDDTPYTLDSIALPFENPYKSWIRPGGLDFFADGRLVVSTWSGDVWIATGIDENLESIVWKRYATGLFQALGLKIVDDTIYVLGRDQITRLHDLNKDGEADWYECFNNDVQVTPGFHEFTFDLQTDPQGNFYFLKGGPVNPGGNGWGPLSDHNGCIFKISKDGQKFEVFATGIRAPNGMGVGPNGEVTNGDNQGTWVPADYIHFSKQGDFIEVPDLAHRDPVPDKYSPHLCWIPYSWDNSNGAQVWVTSDKWGPLKGNLLYLSYGKCAMFNVLQETVDGVRQGGVVKFPFKFDSGAMRARFNERDGQLYVAGLRGWQTDGSKDGAIQRVRYTGKTLTMQNGLHITDKGVRIDFTAPLDPSTAGDVANYSVIQYNYRWTSAYGSDKYKVSDPGQKGNDPVEVKAAVLSADKKSVLLEIEGLKPVMQMEIKMNIKAADGNPVPEKVGNTINVVAPADKPGVTYTSSK